MSLLLTKILLLICLPSPCCLLCITPAACISFGLYHIGAGKSCLLPHVCAEQPDPGSGC